MAVPFCGLTCSAQERYENLKPCFKATAYVPQMVPAGTVMLHQARLRHRGMSENNPCDMRAAGRRCRHVPVIVRALLSGPCMLIIVICVHVLRSRLGRLYVRGVVLQPACSVYSAATHDHAVVMQQLCSGHVTAIQLAWDRHVTGT